MKKKKLKKVIEHQKSLIAELRAINAQQVRSNYEAVYYLEQALIKQKDKVSELEAATIKGNNEAKTTKRVSIRGNKIKSIVTRYDTYGQVKEVVETTTKR